MGIEEHRGPHVNDVERFDHMLPLALWISGHTGDIFEIDLPARHGRRALHGLMQPLFGLGDAIMGFEDAINRLGGGYGELEEQQGTVTLEVVANGLLAWYTPQAFGWLIAYGQHLLDHQGMRLDGGMLARTRMAWQNVG